MSEELKHDRIEIFGFWDGVKGMIPLSISCKC
jgi:hypothetical protein